VSPSLDRQLSSSRAGRDASVTAILRAFRRARRKRRARAAVAQLRSPRSSGARRTSEVLSGAIFPTPRTFRSGWGGATVPRRQSWPSNSDSRQGSRGTGLSQLPLDDAPSQEVPRIGCVPCKRSEPGCQSISSTDPFLLYSCGDTIPRLRCGAKVRSETSAFQRQVPGGRFSFFPCAGCCTVARQQGMHLQH